MKFLFTYDDLLKICKIYDFKSSKLESICHEFPIDFKSESELKFFILRLCGAFSHYYFSEIEEVIKDYQNTKQEINAFYQNNYLRNFYHTQLESGFKKAAQFIKDNPDKLLDKDRLKNHILAILMKEIKGASKPSLFENHEPFHQLLNGCLDVENKSEIYFLMLYDHRLKKVLNEFWLSFKN